MSDENDDLEFIDETLPILRVYDLLTVDEMADADPSFIGVTDTDVMNYTYDFFPSPEKARGISKTWREVINKGNKCLLAGHWIPLVNMERTSAPAPDVLIDNHMRVLAIQDVQQRREELEKAEFPYAMPESTFPSLSVQNLHPPIEMESIEGDSFKLTKLDAKHLGARKIGIVGLKENPKYSKPTGLLIDAICPSVARPTSPTSHFTVAGTVAGSWRTKLSRLDRERKKRIISETADDSEMDDIDTVYRHLGRNGVSSSDLKARELYELTSRWEGVKSDSKKSKGPVVEVKPIHQERLFTDALEDAANALLPEKLEEVIGKIERRLAGMEAPVAGFTSLLPSPLTPLALAQAIDGNEEPIDSYVEAYRDIVKNEEKAAARIALEGGKASLEQSEQWLEQIKHIKERFELTLQSVFHSVKAIDSAFPAFSDEKQAKAGDDITGYTGSTMFVQTQTTEAATETETTATTIEDDHELVQNSQYSEILQIVSLELQKIARSTQLPLDLDIIIALVAPHINEPSRVALLEERLPGVPKEQLLILLADPSQAEWYDTPAVKRALQEVSDLFKEALFNAMSCALATWTVVLQETFADRRLLNYKPPPSLTTCASMWGFHGPPMTRTKGRGTLMYLLCALSQRANALFSDFLDPTAEHRIAAIGELAESMHPVRVASLKDAFESLKPVLLAQKEELKREQAELKAFLEGNGSIDRLVAGLLQLPKIMAMGNDTFYVRRQRGTASCCAQNLGKEFRAYADWPSYRPLRGLLAQMKGLAKYGVLLSKEAPIGLVVISAQPKKPSEDRKALTYISQKVASSDPLYVEVEEFKTAWAQWLPNVASSQKYIEERLESISKIAKTPKAYIAWVEALNAATLQSLSKLGMQLATKDALCLHAMRGASIRDRDEQRVLDMARVLIVTWACKNDEAAAIFARFASVLAAPSTLSHKISELRERQKAAVLNKLNSKDPEMRKLLTQMNRVGVVNIRADLDAPTDAADAADVADVANDDDINPNPTPSHDAIAEQDYAWQGEDHDGGVDVLDA